MPSRGARFFPLCFFLLSLSLSPIFHFCCFTSFSIFFFPHLFLSSVSKGGGKRTEGYGSRNFTRKTGSSDGVDRHKATRYNANRTTREESTRGA